VRRSSRPHWPLGGVEAQCGETIVSSGFPRGLNPVALSYSGRHEHNPKTTDYYGRANTNVPRGTTLPSGISGHCTKGSARAPLRLSIAKTRAGAALSAAEVN